MSDISSLISFGSTSPSPGNATAVSVRSAAWSVIAAHLLELRTAEVIDDAALSSVALAMVAVSEQAGTSETSARAVYQGLIRRIEQRVPAPVAGVVTLGLSAEELLATVGRIQWRQMLLSTMGSTWDVASSVQRLAETHVVTIMPAYLGGQPVQPTTLAHFLGGVIEPLDSAWQRLFDAYGVVNRSPLGAGLLTGDVVGAERGDLASRLGFGGSIANTLVALSEVGDLIQAVDAVSAVLTALERFVKELQVWVRTDPTSFVLDEPWMESPEVSHPSLSLGYRLDALQFGLAGVIDRLDGCRAGLRRLGYGPLGAGHDVVVSMADEIDRLVQPLMTESAQLFTTGIVVNRAYLGNRAGRYYTTAPDLATFLMTEENLPPTVARQIAILVLSRVKEMRLEVSGITPDMIDSAALLTIGRELKVEMETLGRFLAPRRYIERRQVTGAAAPDMTREWLEQSAAALSEHERWLDTTRGIIQRTMDTLGSAIETAAAMSLDD